ncbi:biopolymer transporter ExbD [Sphingomonas psychrotolerans]|uniref:Biopolymer transporter ExbD n=1 Tax=Sphingomonas psychrotolerans TaxID=1327635 RepID=A0ABU3MZL8_9SPHN|nr:hypothetical protein [Sphingomonas psychrotolerans]MDT8757740.1 biopolymer transporter ExbD [Sphingomonas psychrotolerans]
MKLVGPVAAVLGASALAGCATTLAPFNVLVRGPATSCSVEVQGRSVTTEELLAIAREEAKTRRAADVDFDGAAPYRCIGGAIYILQMAGFKKVGFVSEPRKRRP